MGNSATKPTAELDREIDGVRYTIKFENKSFDKGACRLAFKGEYHGKGARNKQKCVTKVFINEAKRHYNEYQPDLKCSQKAFEFAEAFNANFSSTKPLRFVVPELATVTSASEGNLYVKTGDKIIVEDFINEKFNSNNGYEKDVVAAIPAFSHFTFCESNGEFLVCDIQGVRTSTGYTLTDPAVLSRDQQFGPTDTGPSGMTKFFKSHKCTSVCSQFSMPEFNDNRKINKGRVNRKPSSYTFMLGPDEKEANNYFANRQDLPAIME